MSVYDQRDRPAYEPPEPYRNGAENPFILRWWTPEHDGALADLIAQRRWLWYWGASDAIVARTPPAVIEEWRRTDPLCEIRVWYNVLMHFAVARVHALGLHRSVQRGGSRQCPLCGETFLEESLPVPLVDRLGIDRLDLCAPCLRDTVLGGGGDATMSKEGVCQYLRDLTAALGRVPTQANGEGRVDLLPLTTDRRVHLLQVLQRRPTVARVKELFGSWRDALVTAQVVDPRRPKGRGTKGPTA